MIFQLHPQLQRDTFPIGQFALSQLVLMNDSQYPWFILVPRQPEICEIYQLNQADRWQLQQESCLLAQTLATLYQADKMNVAAIGNIVKQLHIHHVVRYQTDKAWPAPVWGKFAAVPYAAEKLAEQKQIVRAALADFLSE
jgi:diadenosine tetraphosphate (Ap4A) HIT family hydrolase